MMRYVKSLSWVWIIILSLMLIDGLWLWRKGMSIDAGALGVFALFESLFLVVAMIYTYLRCDQRLANLAWYTAQFLAYSTSVAIFNYLVVTFDRPLIDETLRSSDHVLGFDWPFVYEWVLKHPTIQKILVVAYNSVVVQMGCLTMVLISLRRFDRVKLFLWLYIVTTLIFIVIGGIVPAAGAFGYYQQATDTLYVRQFYALREGSIKVLELTKLQGVVQFPSFHFALAVFCTYVMRGIRFWYPLFLMLNLVVIVATPPIGGHFLTDLLASAVLVVPVIYLVERCLKASCAKETSEVNL